MVLKHCLTIADTVSMLETLTALTEYLFAPLFHLSRIKLDQKIHYFSVEERMKIAVVEQCVEVCEWYFSDCYFEAFQSQLYVLLTSGLVLAGEEQMKVIRGFPFHCLSLQYLLSVSYPAGNPIPYVLWGISLEQCEEQWMLDPSY